MQSLTIARCRTAEDDPPKEECQERNPVLPDGLRCLGNRYVSASDELVPLLRMGSPVANARPSVLGRTTFVNTLCGKTVLPHKESDDPTAAHVEDGVKIKPLTVGMICRRKKNNT